MKHILYVFLLCSSFSIAAPITTIQSDWTTYRFDLVADFDYDVFGGGPAGDIFHIYVDFNKAYLPYMDNAISEWPLTQAIPDRTTTDDLTDYVQFTDRAIRTGHAAFEVNGQFYTAAVFGVSFDESGLTSFSHGSQNFPIFDVSSSTGEMRFLFTDDVTLGDVRGGLLQVVDLGGLVTVPEPSSAILLCIALIALRFKRFIPKFT